MNKLYCPECGSKNEYSLNPPKFCGGCGVPMGDGFPDTAVAKKGGGAKGKTRVKIPQERGDKMQDYETDIMHVPKIRRLDVELSYEGNARVFKGSDMLDARGETPGIDPSE